MSDKDFYALYAPDTAYEVSAHDKDEEDYEDEDRSDDEMDASEGSDDMSLDVNEVRALQRDQAAFARRYVNAIHLNHVEHDPNYEVP